MKKTIKKEEAHVKCPHCLKEIDTVWVCRVKSIIGVRYVFFCSDCQKNIGISSQKEFVVNQNSFRLPGNEGILNTII